MDRPVVVVVDCSPKSPSINSDDAQRLLRDILGDQYASATPVNINCSDDILEIYPLRLETKYYTSDVGLCILQSPTIGDQKFADSVEAVILFLSNHDEDKNSSFSASLVDPWLSFIQHWEETSVKLLACKRAASGSKNRLSMQQWCIKNDFELVELDPDEEARSEADDCGEVIGVRRISQALKAHSWSNLIMKDERTMDVDRAERLQSYLQETDRNLADAANTSDDAAEIASLAKNLDQATISDSVASGASKLHSDIDQLLKTGDPFADQEAIMRAAVSEDDGKDDVSFEDLFGRFAEMKEMASSLPPDQRKAYAEKVTMAFWRAIGGDENEIAGIGDSSDDDNDGTKLNDKQ